ncbi:MAG: hypothetical protein HOP19_22480, partial [Acidobacteria bacterium]|nr:hypothetical protein [Acidobacteriota bacterium]
MKSGKTFSSFRNLFNQTLAFKQGEHGVATAVFVLGLFSFLAVGSLAVDISHQITAGVELQNAADAAAHAGATALDGTIGGITAAGDRAMAITTTIGNVKGNTYDFDSAITLSRSDIRYAVNLGDFDAATVGYNEADAKLRAAAIRFIKVKIPTHFVRGVFTNVAIGKKFLGVTREAVGSMAQSGLLPASPTAPQGTPPVLNDTSTINTVCDWVPLSALQSPHNFMPLNVKTSCGNAYKFTPGCTYIIKAGANGNATGFVAGGNFQALAPIYPNGSTDQGGADLRVNIAGGIKFCIHPGDLVGTEPGNNTGTVRQGLNSRFGDYNGGLNATTYPPDINVKQGITYAQY